MGGEKANSIQKLLNELRAVAVAVPVAVAAAVKVIVAVAAAVFGVVAAAVVVDIVWAAVAVIRASSRGHVYGWGARVYGLSSLSVSVREKEGKAREEEEDGKEPHEPQTKINLHLSYKTFCAI